MSKASGRTDGRKRRADPPRTAPVLVVQQILSVWREPSCAGPGSARSGVAEALLIPLEPQEHGDAAMLEHRATWNEFLGAEQPTEQIIPHADLAPFQVGCVWVNPDGDRVRVIYYHSPEGGAPRREWVQKTFEVRAGEWAQIAYNGRFSAESYWWYEKTVVNVGRFGSVTAELFLRGDPTYRYAAFSHLW